MHLHQKKCTQEREQEWKNLYAFVWLHHKLSFNSRPFSSSFCCITHLKLLTKKIISCVSAVVINFVRFQVVFFPFYPFQAHSNLNFLLKEFFFPIFFLVLKNVKYYLKNFMRFDSFAYTITDHSSSTFANASAKKSSSPTDDVRL